MKSHSVLLLLLLAGLVSARSDTAAPAKTSGPRIEFSTNAFNFGKIDVGQFVRHTFYFTNTGDQPLEIRDVRPSCGCTTAGGYDKNVDPGKSGAIPVRFNSAGFKGDVHKTIVVMCNDPAKTNINLEISGTIFEPFELSQLYAVFNLPPDGQTNETQVIRIVSHLDEPITLSDPVTSNSLFRAELKPIKPGHEWEAHVTVMPPVPIQSVLATFTCKTSSSRSPSVAFHAYAVTKPALSVTPAQIILPRGPLTNSPKITVRIENNSTNSVTLSEPATTAPGAQAQLRETLPGRVFELTMAFPAAFQSQPSQIMEATVKSTNPKFAVIRIPIFQTFHVPGEAPVAPATSKK